MTSYNNTQPKSEIKIPKWIAFILFVVFIVVGLYYS